MMSMAKNKADRHSPVREAGYEIRRSVLPNVTFFWKYIRSECAEFSIKLKIEGNVISVPCLRLSFCLVCGRFLGFGTRYDVCFDCDFDLEQPELEVNNYA